MLKVHVRSPLEEASSLTAREKIKENSSSGARDEVALLVKEETLSGCLDRADQISSVVDCALPFFAGTEENVREK